MKAFFYRLIFLLVLALLQLSFLDVVFPNLGTPALILAAVVAWVLVKGFLPALRMTIPLVFFFELLTAGNIGSLSLYALLLGYATSFLSRRMLIEHKGYGLLAYAVVSAFGVWGYRLFESLFFHPGTILTLLSFGNIVSILILGALSFLAAYLFVKRFEHSIDFSERREMLNIR